MVHGFAGLSKKGIILVKAEQQEFDEMLRISVCDNGCGMDLQEDALPGKLGVQAQGTLTKVGLQNVDRRIKLNYGEEYGLSVTSRPGYYTRTRILLPVIKDTKR